MLRLVVIPELELSRVRLACVVTGHDVLAERSVTREDPMKADKVHPLRWYQRRQACHEVQGLKDHGLGAIGEAALERVDEPSVFVAA